MLAYLDSWRVTTAEGFLYIRKVGIVLCRLTLGLCYLGSDTRNSVVDVGLVGFPLLALALILAHLTFCLVL